MEQIKVRNNLRRPVMFRVPGKSIRLSPGQSTEIPQHCLQARELKKLCLRNSVSILREKKEEPIKIEPETGTIKEDEKKEKKTEETVKAKGKAKKPGKSPKKTDKHREKKTGPTGGDQKPQPLEEE
jgi:hypothetical protein